MVEALSDIFFSSMTWTLIRSSFWWLWFFFPVWGPVIALWMAGKLWMRYIRLKYMYEEKHTLLEIKLPEDIQKSPSAMEVVLTAMYQTSTPTLYKTFVKGEVRPQFSLELVSIGGEVHFFIRTPSKVAHLVQTQIYAQYPNAEILEVPDYTEFTESDPSKIEMWGTYFKLTGKDDIDPIKTYVDYNLDKPEKPEQEINPITSVLEYLGAIKRGEQVWIQILIRGHKKGGWKEGESLLPQKDWKERIDDKVNDLLKKAKKSDSGETLILPYLEPGADDAIKGYKRHKGKLPFDVGIRGMYISESDSFSDFNIVGLIGSFRQYNHQDDNGFKLGYFTDVSEFTKNVFSIFPFWEDWYANPVRHRMKKEFFEAYRLRSFFYPPYHHYKQRPFVLSSEEIATLFHFPGGAAQTPTFKRIESKKSEPPSNLPV